MALDTVSRFSRILFLGLVAFAVPVSPAMAQDSRIAMIPNGSKTMSSPGRFVEIPGFPGKRIDRRLLPDVAWLVRRYDLRITSAYSLSKAHEQNGEHPRGLAIDVVPARGGTWASLARLARWAKPGGRIARQPFRWVGYNGDAGHGDPSRCKVRKGCLPHLHLSWQHGYTPRARPAPWVNVLRFRPLDVPGHLVETDHAADPVLGLHQLEAAVDLVER
jgi:hypothetical protein